MSIGALDLVQRNCCRV